MSSESSISGLCLCNLQEILESSEPRKLKGITLTYYRCTEGSAGGQKSSPHRSVPVAFLSAASPLPLSLPASPRPPRSPRLSPWDTHTHSLPRFLWITLSVNTALPIPCGWPGARAKKGVEGYYSRKVWLLLPPALNFKVQFKTKQKKNSAVPLPRPSPSPSRASQAQLEGFSVSL